MMAVGSFKKVAGTALGARGEHDQISAVEIFNPAARIVRPMPNAAIWMSNEGRSLKCLGTAIFASNAVKGRALEGRAKRAPVFLALTLTLSVESPTFGSPEQVAVATCTSRPPVLDFGALGRWPCAVAQSVAVGDFNGDGVQDLARPRARWLPALQRAGLASLPSLPKAKTLRKPHRRWFLRIVSRRLGQSLRHGQRSWSDRY